MTIYSRAPGKMILIGEYAVLEGAPALVRAVDRFALVEVCDNPVGNFTVEAPNLSVPAQDFVITSGGEVRFDPNAVPVFIKRLSFFARLFETVWQFYSNKNIKIDYCKIDLNTASFYDAELNNKIGVGSSAALTAALVNAIDANQNNGEMLSKKDIFMLALKAHRYAQKGIGSGIDIASSVYGGIIEYTMVKDDESNFKEPKRIDYPADLNIISVWTGKSASTRKMVGSVSEFKNRSYLRYKEIMDNLSATTGDACESFKKKDVSRFLESCAEYYKQLLELGNESSVSIISDVHKDIEKIVRNGGGVYKPSGAGSGDFGIAMTSDAEKALYLKTLIEENGFKTVNLSTSDTGVQIY
jgi:phosphomevalonate kinase